MYCCIQSVFLLDYMHFYSLNILFLSSSLKAPGSAHFVDEDFLPPDRAGRRNFKKDSVPSVFNWPARTTQRRKIVRHVER